MTSRLERITAFVAMALATSAVIVALLALADAQQKKTDKLQALYDEAKGAVDKGRITQGLRDIVFALTPAEE